MDFSFKAPRPGKPISRRQIAKLMKTVEQLQAIGLQAGPRAGNAPILTAGGPTIDNNIYQPFWAQITGSYTDGNGNTAYTWQERFMDVPGEPQDHDEGRDSDPGGVTPAYEYNGNSNVPTGTNVLMWLGYDSQTYYVFAYCCGGDCGLTGWDTDQKIAITGGGTQITTLYRFYIHGNRKNDSYLSDSTLTNRADDYDGIITLNQSLTGVTIVNPGTGYKQCDVLTVGSSGGTSTDTGQVQVGSVSSGGISSAGITDPGSYSTTPDPTSAVALNGGSGSGATARLTFSQTQVSVKQKLRLYWQCGYEDVVVIAVNGNVVGFIKDTGNIPLPAAGTEILVATAGKCC